MQTMVLAGATVIDGTGAAPMRDAAVVIDDGVIRHVGPARDADGARVDLRGRWLIPGLINAHEHIALKGFQGAYYDQYRQDPQLQMLRMAQNALRAFAEGVTTIRDCGAIASAGLLLDRAVEANVVRGARVFTCGRVIQPSAVDEGAGALGMSREARGADEVAALARALIDEGADFVKLKIDRSRATAGGPRVAFESAEVRAAFDAAHASGRPASFHGMQPADVRTGLEAGADVIEHGLYLAPDLDVVDEIGRRGAALVPCWTSWGTSQHGSAQRRDDHRRVVLRAVERGVPLACGTDLYALALADEIDALAGMGLGALGAIAAATANAAKLLGADDRIGSIRAGRRADIVVLDADPLADLAALRHPALVLKDGATVFSAARDIPRGLTPLAS